MTDINPLMEANIRIKNRFTSRTQDSLFIAIEDQHGRVYQKLIPDSQVGRLGYSDMCLLLTNSDTELVVTYTEEQSSDGIIRLMAMAWKVQDETMADIRNDAHIPSSLRDEPS